MGTVIIFASTSGIGEAVAEEFLRRDRDILLCGRDEAALVRQSRDLEIRFGRKVPFLEWNVLDFEGHAEKVERCFGTDVDGIFVAAGVMHPQPECEKDPALILQTILVNLSAVAVLLNHFAEPLQARGRGFISCVSSVAGDRGRQSNYIYGASKAGLSALLQGMRNRLARHGILVQTVKPGFVRTRMTSHMWNSPLMTDPDRVAWEIVTAIEKKKEVVYCPFYWRFVMLAISSIPEVIFKRMRL